MDEILSFLRDNWQFVVEVLMLIVGLILALCKKQVKITIPDEFYSEVPELISAAETEFGAGHGEEKLQFVITHCIRRLSAKYGFTVSSLKGVIPSLISYVESVLLTPTKKGK